MQLAILENRIVRSPGMRRTIFLMKASLDRRLIYITSSEEKMRVLLRALIDTRVYIQ